MFAGQRELRVGMIESRRSPDSCGMAGLAVMREITRHVRRIVGPLEVVRVATVASRRKSRVDPILMAIGARHGGMPAGQRELCCGMVKRRGRPGRCRVTGLALTRETAAHVRRIGGRLEITGMAAVAGGGQPGILAVLMALSTLHARMPAGQRKLRRRMVE